MPVILSRVNVNGANLYISQKILLKQQFFTSTGIQMKIQQRYNMRYGQ